MKAEQVEKARAVNDSKYRKVAGALVFAVTTQFAIVMIVAESLYRYYSVANNYISDLGVGPTGPVFDTSVSILGISVIVASYLSYKIFESRIFLILVALTGIGALSVGIFNESYSGIHGLVSLLTFVAGSLTSIYAFRFTKSPMNYFSIMMGLFSLGALAVALSGSTAGLGVGGIERMIAYPYTLWGIAFGGYLMGSSQQK